MTSRLHPVLQVNPLSPRKKAAPSFHPLQTVTKDVFWRQTVRFAPVRSPLLPSKMSTGRRLKGHFHPTNRIIGLPAWK